MKTETVKAYPIELENLKQWILWKNENGDKVPYQVNGYQASITNPSSWMMFDKASKALASKPGFSGLGFVFTAEDSYAGIDLDDCLECTGEFKPWAKEIADLIGPTYREISPSGNGVKFWVRGKFPAATGKKTKVGDGAVEVYDHARYFTVTGNPFGKPYDIADGQDALDAIYSRDSGVTSPDVALEAPQNKSNAADLCLVEIMNLPDSISGDDGHGKLLRACCEILRYGIDGDEGIDIVRKFNAEKADPVWTEKEILHKWRGRARPSDAGKILWH